MGLKETDLGLQYGSRDTIAANFVKDMGKLTDLLLSEIVSAAGQSGTKQAWNKLGAAYAQYGMFDKAEEAVDRALRLDPSYVPAAINKGNIYYAKKDFSRALSYFKELDAGFKQKQAATPVNEFAVCINLSETCYALEDFKSAADYFARASKISPEKAAGYGRLAQVPVAGGSAVASASGGAAAAGAGTDGTAAAGRTAEGRAADITAVPILVYIEE